MTDSPEQRRLWAEQISDAGHLIVGGGLNPSIEALTQIIRHKNMSRLWGYIVGSRANADPPATRHPYKCKCDRPAFDTYKSLSNHRRYCEVWPISHGNVW